MLLLPWPFHPVLLTFTSSSQPQSPPPLCPRLLSVPASSQSPPPLSSHLLSVPTPLSPHSSQSPPPLLCLPWRGGSGSPGLNSVLLNGLLDQPKLPTFPRALLSLIWFGYTSPHAWASVISLTQRCLGLLGQPCSFRQRVLRLSSFPPTSLAWEPHVHLFLLLDLLSPFCGSQHF